MTPEEVVSLPLRREARPYTGDSPVCPKCLFAGAGVTWMPPVPGHAPECLARECHSCSFTWYEDVATQLHRALTDEEIDLVGE